MKKPLIGIVGNLLFDEGGMFPGYDRAYVNNDYVQTTVIAGGVPFILPLIPDYESCKTSNRSCRWNYNLWRI